MEHLRHEQRHHSTDLRPQKRLGSHGARGVVGIRVDGGGVDQDHGEPE